MPIQKTTKKPSFQPIWVMVQIHIDVSHDISCPIISLSLWGGYMYELRLSAQSHSQMQQRTQGQ